MKSRVQLSPNIRLENINEMFKKLYNDEQLADVTLCCKDGNIKAHKLILATSSPYFYKIFTENNRDHPILIMHGVSYQNLHDLIELIYKGNVDVLPESLDSLYELAGEFQLSGISGVLREEGEKSSDSGNFRNEGGGHGRDTRYKGQKRVAVDYKGASSAPKKINKGTNKQTKKGSPNSNSDEIEVEVTADHKKPVPPTKNPVNEKPPKLTVWAQRNRIHKCDLCPSSFKRAQHLTRHRLIHTGEKPYACDQCDKVFSRHYRLLDHIKKAHERNSETDDDIKITHAMQPKPSPSPPPSSLLPFVILDVRSEASGVNEESATPPSPPKRSRRRHKL